MTLQAYAEPTSVRTYLAPQPLYATAEPTMVRQLETPRQASQPARPSTFRTVGRIFDWTAISLMSLSVCAFICQQGFGVFTNG